MDKTFRNVSIVGIGQIPVQKKSPLSLREMGVQAMQLAMEDAGVDAVDAVFVGNMLGDELQNQKHLAALIASAAGLRGVEALQVQAATATGAAALRMAYFAVASGEARRAIALGVEQMSSAPPDVVTAAIAKALDAERETPQGWTMLKQNARLMQLYMERYQVPASAFNGFALTAHENAFSNPNALFVGKQVTPEMIDQSRVIHAPLRLYDAAPICDGAAAVLLTRTDEARAYTDQPVNILSSSVATDWFCVEDRPKPLELYAVRRSALEAFRKANVHRSDIDIFELHDAFSIMACLTLEAVGFAPAGHGWRMAAEGQLALHGSLPIATLGGLKGRGHPIGATALYQTSEIVLQLTGKAGANQVHHPRKAMLVSVGGAASTVLTHIFGVE
ncbi:MAG TPA: beta-ketoacyl synthase N-terminal-like domain-containing protein [Anaerolineales bacterium]|nr:beta-ketoacyl synthase N-terminal-like domain-containing protein [Anaerolineales bacterium]